jgi:hypothetical protein
MSKHPGPEGAERNATSGSRWFGWNHMKWHSCVKRLSVLVAFGIVAACQGQGRVTQKAPGDLDGAVQILHRYIQLRLQDADWRAYSKFVTWPDEPSWDCKWVVTGYTVGTPSKEAEGTVIPIFFKRIGLFCYEFSFEAQPKTVTIHYNLAKRQGRWKVDGPIPDYPEIAADVLVKSLKSSAGNKNTSPQQRTRALAAVQQIRDAISAGPSR